MFQEERAAEILKMVKEGRSFTVKELTGIFEVSESTIRRDLTLLEDQGFIIRTHGGVINKESIANETLYQERQSEHQEEKEKIAREAYKFIHSNEVIILDAGTTTMELAIKLSDFKKRLVVITHALNIAHFLKDFDNIELILLGGCYHKNSRALSGAITKENLSTFHANKAFLGINGISCQYGLTTPFIEEAQTKTEMIRVSDESFVLGDHSKFNKVFVKKVADLSEVDYIITDDNMNPRVEQEFKNSPVKIIKAGNSQ